MTLGMPARRRVTGTPGAGGPEPGAAGPGVTWAADAGGAAQPSGCCSEKPNCTVPSASTAASRDLS
jgi:hypothetical protein